MKVHELAARRAQARESADPLKSVREVLEGLRENGSLRKAGEVTLTRGAILPMQADTPHVAECPGDAPAIGLHVYGGAIPAPPRRMWNPRTLDAV